MTNEEKDPSFDLVGVLVGDGEKICNSVTLKWNDRKFKIWVDETMGEWVPDCISDGDSWDKKTVNIPEAGEKAGPFFSESLVRGGRSPESVGDEGSSKVDQIPKGQEDEQLGGSFHNCMENVQSGNAAAHFPLGGSGGPDFLEKGEFPSGCNFNFKDFVEPSGSFGGPDVPVKAQRKHIRHKAQRNLFVSSTGQPKTKKRRRVDDPLTGYEEMESSGKRPWIPPMLMRTRSQMRRVVFWKGR
ncbi:hypothetical protein Hanom_Chr08g00714921 [Helianthus anomalus]